jgi:hypothetical protein
MNVPIIAGGVAKILDVAAQALNFKEDYDQAKNTSLSRAAKRAHIPARMYVDGNIAGDAIVGNIARAAQSLYISLIISVHQLNQLVSGGKTITDSLKTISTESLLAYRDTGDDFGDFVGLDTPATESTDASRMAEDAINELKDEDSKQKLRDKDKDFETKYRSKSIAVMDDSGAIPSGRLIELKFAAEKGKEISINVLVQLFPIIIRPSIAVEFIKLDAMASWGQRWLQWRVGEISFLDLFFSLDQIRQRRNIIRSDRDNVLVDYIGNRIKKEGSRWNRLFEVISNSASKSKTAVSNNLASSIMVFSEDTVLRAKSQTGGFDLHNTSDRNKYFNKTFSLMIFIVDPMYDKITLYLNGLDIKGEYSFDQFKPKGSNNEVVEIMKTIQAISQGRTPTF